MFLYVLANNLQQIYTVLLFDSLPLGALGHDGKYGCKLPPAGQIVELKVKIPLVGRFVLILPYVIQDKLKYR